MERSVDTKQKEKLGPLKMEGFNHLGPAQFAWDTPDLTDTGIIGAAGEIITATEASSERGLKLMEPYVKEVSEFVEALKRADVANLLCKPHK